MTQPVRRRPLTARDLGAEPRIPVSGLPQVVKFATQLSDSCCAALSGFGSASWKLSVDRIEDVTEAGGLANATLLTIAAPDRTLTALAWLDQAAISAVIDVAMGGSGMEEPFEFEGRPFSAIEREILAMARGKLAEAVAAALSQELGAPHRVEKCEADVETVGKGEPLLSFRFVVNVFGYSGELRIVTPAEPLNSSLAVLAEASGAAKQVDDFRTGIKREVGRAAAEVSVSLQPSWLTVEEIVSLYPGKVLKLDTSVKADVSVSSDNVVLFKGALARSGDHLAVRILSSV